MMGIEDTWVALAFVLCGVSTLICVVYAWMNWNRGDDSVQPDDLRWEAEEKKAEEQL